MEIIAIARSYNEEKNLDRYLDQMSRLCSKILILDDGSTDNSDNIYKKYDKCLVHKQEHCYHEGKMCNFLYKWAEEFKPDWINCCDIDEVFDIQDEHKILDLVKNPKINSYIMPNLYLWNDNEHYRYDGIYKNITAIRLYRYVKGAYPDDREKHVAPLPKDRKLILPEQKVNIPILHYGYMDKSDREKKYKFYSNWDKTMEDYEHIISDKITLKSLEERHKSLNIKLTLGAWVNKVPGTIGIGLESGIACDRILDVRKLDEEFEECSVSNIYTYDMIEHIVTQEIVPMFKVWYKIMDYGGRLEIATIDLEIICKQFLEAGLDERKALINHFYGSQSFNSDFHFSGYTFAILKDYLTQAGFKNIKRCKASYNWGSALQVEAFK